MNTLSRAVILVLSLFILFFPRPTFALTEVFDEITTSTTWSKSGSPYVLNDSIAIFSGATLTIEPGVVIKVHPTYSFSKNGIDVLNGKIIAIGSETEPIIFTSSYDDTVGGDTDYYEDCYEPMDEMGNITGPEVCDRYDIGDPSYDDWEGVYFSQSNGSVFRNVHIKYANEGLTLYKSNISIEKAEIDEVGEAFTVYETSEVRFSDLSISNIYSYAASIFNHSTFTGINLIVGNISHSRNDIVEIFNHSILEITNAEFEDCGNEACITIFDSTNYFATPSRATIKNTAFGGGLGSGVQAFSHNDIPIMISNSVFRDFSVYAIENYSNITTIQAKDNDWGDPSGPYHATVNPNGLGEKIYGLVDFDPWIGKGPDSPDQYYARITNIPGGVANLYDEPTTASTLVKTLPNDWVVRVIDKIGKDGKPMITDGYYWYKVEDPTDKTIHYMISGTSSKAIYLPYDESKQLEYENVSVDNLSGTTTVQKNKRRQVVLEALEHYYNDIGTEKSLYSSDDHTPDISVLKKSNRISKEIILAIIVQEIGSVGFDNEFVSYDYGHGIFQVTMDAYANEPGNKYGYTFLDNDDDPRGRYSEVKLKKRKEEASEEYKKCYKRVYNNKGKLWKQEYAYYEGIINNPKYKQYANTIQSIYTNIKDGLGILSEKYNSAVRKSCRNGDYIVEGYVFTCDDLVKVKTIWFYNGQSTRPEQIYMKEVSEKLKTLSTYFPGVSYNNSDNLIEKLEIANRYRVEIKAHSPIEISISDSSGNIVGVVNGEDVTTMPNAVYDADTETAVIFFPDDDYTYKVVGDNAGGMYGLDIKNYNGSDIPVVFNAVDIPIVTNEVHTYTVDQQKLAEGKSDAVSISVDKEGDGEAEKIINTGVKLIDLEDPTIDLSKLLDEYIVGTRLSTKDFVTDNKDKPKNIKILAQWNGADIQVLNNKIPLIVYGSGTLTIIATDSAGNTSMATKRIKTTYAFKGFRAPVVGTEYTVQKSLPIRLRLGSLYRAPIPPQDLRLKIVKINDGSEVLSCLSYCFVSNSNLYTFLVPKNKLLEGEYRIDVSIEDNVYTTNVVMIK